MNSKMEAIVMTQGKSYMHIIAVIMVVMVIVTTIVLLWTLYSLEKRTKPVWQHKENQSFVTLFNVILHNNYD